MLAAAASPSLGVAAAAGAAGAAGVAGAAALASGAGAQQTPTALAPLAGDTESEANAINPRGEVAGFSIGGSGADTAVVWR